MQEGSLGVGGPRSLFGTHQHLWNPPFPILLSLSATVSAAVVPTAPIFSPTMGGGSNSSLSLDSGGAEPMPGVYLTLDTHSALPQPLFLSLEDLADLPSR